MRVCLLNQRFSKFDKIYTFTKTLYLIFMSISLTTGSSSTGVQATSREVVDDILDQWSSFSLTPEEESPLIASEEAVAKGQ